MALGEGLEKEGDHGHATSRAELQKPANALPTPTSIPESPLGGCRFDPVQTGLPLATESQCLECEKVLPALW